MCLPQSLFLSLDAPKRGIFAEMSQEIADQGSRWHSQNIHQSAAAQGKVGMKQWIVRVPPPIQPGVLNLSIQMKNQRR